MEGYSKDEYKEFSDEEDDEEEPQFKKRKLKYSNILKEESFIEEEV